MDRTGAGLPHPAEDVRRARRQVEGDSGAGRGGGDVCEVQRIVLGAGCGDQDAVEDAQRGLPADPVGGHRVPGCCCQLRGGACRGLRVAGMRDPVGHPTEDPVDGRAFVAPERIVGVGRHLLILAPRRLPRDRRPDAGVARLHARRCSREAIIRSSAARLMGDDVAIARRGSSASTASVRSSMFPVSVAANLRWIPQRTAATRIRPRRLVARSAAVDVRVNGRCGRGTGMGCPRRASNSVSVATGPAGTGAARDGVAGPDVDRGGAADVRRGGSHHDLVVAGLHQPVVGRHVPDREGASPQHHLRACRLPGLQVHLRESGELLGGAGERGLDGTHVDLHDLAAGSRPGVGDVHPHDQVGAVTGDLHLAALERRVAQPVAEGEARRDVVGVVEAVAHVERLAVLHLPRVPGEVGVGGQLRDVEGDALGQPATGFGGSEQHIGQRGATGLPAEVGLDECGGPVGPRDVDGPTVDQHDGSPRVGVEHDLGELVHPRRHPPLGAVPGLRLEPCRQPHDQDDPIRGAGDRRSLGHQGRGGVAGGRVVPRGVGHLRPPGDLRGEGLEQGVDPGGVDLRAARPLVAGVHRERPDHGDRALGGQRQEPVVGQQDSARGGGATGQLVMGLEVEHRLVGRLPDLLPAQRQLHHPGWPSGSRRPPRAARRRRRRRCRRRMPRTRRASRGPCRHGVPPRGRWCRPSRTPPARRSPTRRAARRRRGARGRRRTGRSPGCRRS